MRRLFFFRQHPHTREFEFDHATEIRPEFCVPDDEREIRPVHRLELTDRGQQLLRLFGRNRVKRFSGLAPDPAAGYRFQLGRQDGSSGGGFIARKLFFQVDAHFAQRRADFLGGKTGVPGHFFDQIFFD